MLGRDPHGARDLRGARFSMLEGTPEHDAWLDAADALIDGTAAETLGLQHARPEDFTSVEWLGKTYHFNRSQAIAVATLWDAWEGGGRSVHQTTIAKKLKSESGSYRLVHTFRERGGKMHPAWGEMIIKAPVAGAYMLGNGTESPNNPQTRHGSRTGDAPKSRRGKRRGKGRGPA